LNKAIIIKSPVLMTTNIFSFLGWPGISISLLLLTACGPSSQRGQSAQDKQQWVKLGPGGGGSTFIPTFSYASPDHFLIRCDMIFLSAAI